MEGILPDLLKEVAHGKVELLNPLARLLVLDYRLRGLKGKAVSPGSNDFLEKALARETAFFLELPLLSSHPRSLLVGVSWSGDLRNEYPSERILALSR